MILNVTGNRCLEGEVPPTDRNIRKGVIYCVVNNQTLGFKLWVRGEEEGAHGERRQPDHLFFGAVTALQKNTITARPADWRSPSIRGITHNKNRFNRNDSNCNHLITQSPARVSLPNLLFCCVLFFLKQRALRASPLGGNGRRRS